MPKERANAHFWASLPLRNELCLRPRGTRDLTTKSLYSAMRLRPEYMYEYERDRLNTRPRSIFHGGIFNLTFSLDGNLLFAATENKSLLMFDAHNQRLQHQIRDAHDDCVNYIRFLDSRMFASCSDDCTIALWDLRNLKQKLRTLSGHTHCVKNIEYDESLGCLISSSFDGNVILWDINGQSQSSFETVASPLSFAPTSAYSNDCPHTKALYLSCLLRMRLTHDGTKMIICTSEGYLMIIHDLDLLNLEKDLRGFQSDLYRLMQKGHSSGFDFGSWLNPLFTAKRNRVELISDFPSDNEAHSITSLDVHPHNWSVLSRNISRDENSEWSCVHNIQDYERPSEMMSIELPKETIFPHHPMFQRNSFRIRGTNGIQNNNERAPIDPLGANAPEINANEVHVSPLIIISARTLNRRAHATILNPNTSFKQIELGSVAPKVYCNLPRMTNYIEELNVGPRFIKELCFSPCGRVVASPYEFGFRLLSFNEECSELCDVMYDRSTLVPRPLHEISRNLSHPNFVVTTKFSPTHCMIASGCLGGRVNFHQPVL